MTSDGLLGLVAAASASPSVHNVQPARWKIDGDALILLEDPTRRLTVGDPTGNDAALSLGAMAEGLVIAASKAGFATRLERCDGNYRNLRRIARFEFFPSTDRDGLADVLETRASWRGPFSAPQPEHRAAAEDLAGADRIIVTKYRSISSIAALYDRASFGFMDRDGFRAELRGWMRLRRRHPQWSRDGLNADAMKLSRLEAFAAGLVLGPLFRPLAALGLAPTLLAESKSFANAAGIALFHRPAQEEPFESGRHFHRLWLEIEVAGFGANVLAALADDSDISAQIHADQGIPQGHRLVSAFRFGRRDGECFAPARLPLSEILVN